MNTACNCKASLGFAVYLDEEVVYINTVVQINITFTHVSVKAFWISKF